MAKIGSTDLALVTARVKCCRLGAARLGFTPYDVKGPGQTYPCEYMWREVKPPTTQWTLVTEGVVCGKRPVASFTNILCNAVGPVSFTDTSTPAEQITFWYWDFGDGGTSNDQNPTHIYAAGFYTVTLYVSGDKGTSSATGYVSVMSALVATAVPNPASAGQDVTFTPTFTGGLAPYTYKWAFEVDTLWADLIHAWSLDEPSGARSDAGVGDLHLTELQTVGFADGGADLSAGWLEGDGGAPTLSDSFTVSLWFKTPNDNFVPGPVFLYTEQFLVMLIQHRFYASAGGHAVWPAGVVDDGNWHNAIVWVDQATDLFIHCSVDGGATQNSPTPITAGPITPSAVNYEVGCRVEVLGGVQPGLRMKRVAWWDRALTAGERAALYAGQFYGSGMEIPTYAYPTAGAKVASVTVTSATGCTITDTVDVTVNEAFSVTWVVADNEGGLPGESLFYEFTPTIVGGTAPYTYAWDFSDGEADDTNEIPTQVWARSTWTNPDDIPVTLTVTDATLATAVYSADVTVTFNE